MLCSLLVLIATALSATAEEPKLPGPKIDFPEVDGLTLGKPSTFPQAGLGYSVAYKAPGLVATVYVYNKGLSEIPAGVESKIVKKEIAQAANDLEIARQRGLYTSVKSLGDEEVVQFGKGKSAPAALRRRFEVERPKEGKVLSDIYLTGYQDHFVKIRVTYDPESADAARKKVTTLLDALGKALK